MFTGWFQGMTEGVMTALGEGESVGRALGEGEGVTDSVEEPEALGVRESEPEAQAVGAPEALPEREPLALAHTLAVGLPVWQGEGVRVPRAVLLALCERVRVPEGESVPLPEREGESEALAQGEAEAVAEGERECVGEALTEREREGDTVPLGEGDCVELPDGEGETRALRESPPERVGLGVRVAPERLGVEETLREREPEEVAETEAEALLDGHAARRQSSSSSRRRHIGDRQLGLGTGLSWRIKQRRQAAAEARALRAHVPFSCCNVVRTRTGSTAAAH